VFLFI